MSDNALVPCPRCVSREGGTFCLLCSVITSHKQLTPGPDGVTTIDTSVLCLGKVPAALAVEYTLLKISEGSNLRPKIIALRERHEE